MHKLVDIIRRMRHRRGFGVHSPLAFKLVNEVIRHSHRYAYYAYHRLDNPAEMRLLRLVAVLHPAQITVINATSEERRAITFAGNLGKQVGINFFVDTAPDTKVKHLCKLMTEDSDRALYCRGLSESELAEIQETMTEGVILSAHDYTILLHRPGMPLQHYHV